MKKKISVLLMLVLMLTMLFGMTEMVVAGETSGGSPLATLRKTIAEGEYTCKTYGKIYKFSGNRYKKSDGGYYIYNEVVNQNWQGEANKENSNVFNDLAIDKLKSGERQKLLSDVFTLATAMAADSANFYYGGVDAKEAVTDETVSEFLSIVGQQTGLGSSMLTLIMQNTKPDYVAANRIYAPFSGVVGTILGVVSVLIMACLGITMALDLAYIVIPAFQLALGGDSEGGKGESKGASRIISREAHAAIKAADGGSGGQSGDGSYKAAVGIYFKYRWKGLVLLGICLLYLIQGQIYTLVSMIIDLLSGFLGF